MMIPILKVKAIKRTVEFYTSILGCSLVHVSPDTGQDPAYGILRLNDDEFVVSSHDGDGSFGSAVMVFVDDVQTLYKQVIKQGLEVSHHGDSPVHLAPVEQTWGSVEFYVDDPDGNTLRFVQRA